MSEEIKHHLSNTNNWLRLLFTVVYALVFWLGTWVLGFVVLLNMIILLLTGERNHQLADFGGQVAQYLNQIMRYATLNSDDRPFPFGEWPDADTAGESSPSQPGAAPAAATPTPEADASPEAAAPKKKGARKKAAKKKVSKKPQQAAEQENPQDNNPENTS